MINSENILFVNVKEKHLDILLPIYKQYLDYYHKRYGSYLGGIKLDLKEIAYYLKSQINEHNSVIFMATIGTDSISAAGFTLLSPVYLHDKKAKMWNLNDMFVSSAYRRMGLATYLLNFARDLCKKSGAISITLVTGKVNIGAQAAYEKCGFIRNVEYQDKQNVQYVLSLS